MTHTHSSAPAAERVRGPQKGPQAFRTISEVSEELDVPAHVLRFWESRFTQIRPLKRGGGRRYYRPADVALLKGIRRLLYSEGMTIKGAQRKVRELGVRAIADFGTGEAAAVLPVTSVQPDGPHADDHGQTAPGGANGRAVAVSAAAATGPRPLLTAEKRASLEAALTLLSDLRAELSAFAAKESGAGNVHREHA